MGRGLGRRTLLCCWLSPLPSAKFPMPPPESPPLPSPPLSAPLAAPALVPLAGLLLPLPRSRKGDMERVRRLRPRSWYAVASASSISSSSSPPLLAAPSLTLPIADGAVDGLGCWTASLFPDDLGRGRLRSRFERLMPNREERSLPADWYCFACSGDRGLPKLLPETDDEPRRSSRMPVSRPKE